MISQTKPGEVRDAIIDFLRSQKQATVAEIIAAVSTKLGRDVPPSSVRSYLAGNTPNQFERTGKGTYRLVRAGRR